MRLIAGVALAALTAAPAAAAEQTYPVGRFSEISASSPAEVQVRTGAPASARAVGDAAALSRLDVHVEGDKLVIRTRRGMRWPGRARATVYVTVPALRAASVAGSGDVRVDRVAGPDFAGSVAGSGNLAVAELRTRTATLASAGSGNINAAGVVDQLQASAAGSGNIDARRVRARSARVSAVGSGNVEAQASQQAEVVSVGSGNAIVSGTTNCRVRARGSGEARCG
ncbi:MULTISPECIES: head GIN domain-containing protein [Sphingomonas]|uniref:head GIN domain-containing protein n=1 Tax=Sphingomonas TaxID=13687 RepID=UPI0015EBC1F0|nr:head GIN domain-containing protein [Sphingomonas sp. CGMCC 1.13658]MBA2921031.1 DUF2807 domain-containing protein [Sphingomonas sp. CGMCC 1.13658]